MEEHEKRKEVAKKKFFFFKFHFIFQVYNKPHSAEVLLPIKYLLDIVIENTNYCLDHLQCIVCLPVLWWAQKREIVSSLL